MNSKFLIFILILCAPLGLYLMVWTAHLGIRKNIMKKYGVKLPIVPRDVTIMSSGDETYFGYKDMMFAQKN